VPVWRGHQSGLFDADIDIAHPHSTTHNASALNLIAVMREF
jgi:hypothetical protein